MAGDLWGARGEPRLLRRSVVLDGNRRAAARLAPRSGGAPREGGRGPAEDRRGAEPPVPGDAGAFRRHFRERGLFGEGLDGVDRVDGRRGPVLQLSAPARLPRLHPRDGADLRGVPSGQRVDRRRPAHLQPRPRNGEVPPRLLVRNLPGGVQRGDGRELDADVARCGVGAGCRARRPLEGLFRPGDRAGRARDRGDVPPALARDDDGVPALLRRGVGRCGARRHGGACAGEWTADGAASTTTSIRRTRW